MYKNQYLISGTMHPSLLSLQNHGIRSIPFDGLQIHAHKDLPVVQCVNNRTALALLGHVIDPEAPDATNQEIVNNIAEECLNMHDLVFLTHKICGRYILLMKSAECFVAAGDACHLRQIFFTEIDDAPVLTSSPALFLHFFGFKLNIGADMRTILDSPLFMSQESAWYGCTTPEKRLRRLLPNHYLDLRTNTAKRLPVRPADEFADDDAVMRYAAATLQGTFAALTSRYQLVQALTAGLDSRMLLAASRAYRDKIQYYVCGAPSSNSDDIRVPSRLSERLALSFRILPTEPLRQDFLSSYQQEHIAPRILPKMANIQAHYDQRYEPNIVNINANCSEIARCHYGFTRRNITAEMLLTYSGYNREFPHFVQQIVAWLPDACHYAREIGIPVCDLFYWEQRMGIWGATYPLEQDIAVEELSPFNNRALLMAFSAVDPRKRRPPDYTFLMKFIEWMWPEALSEPINPSRNYLTGIIKGYGTLYYLALKAKRLGF
jgi:hypothetical protein